ncbi:DUF6894 family protein [Methylobacterium nigriterrae]|uniref:DUF6894 family protein n=1 Tax=Methylobacterium nigriterrae TaxID=3127512 RepID=UPI003013DA4E
MPQRYHFRLVCADATIEDPIGVEADSLEVAQEEALAALEEICANGELTEEAGRWHLEIRSASGALLRSIRLDEFGLPS